MREAFGARFDVPEGYLNTASTGIPPVHVADAVADAVTAWRTGSARAPDFDEPVAVARAAYAELVGVPTDRVVIGSTVSGLVSLLAAALPPRSRVVVVRGEFTSLSWPFAARGHEVVEVEPDRIVERAPDADLVAVSVVQSADGRLADLAGLRTCGTPVVLDATQATGWFDGDLGWAAAVVGAGYKWLLSPRGAAWLALHPDRTPPAEQASWYAGEDPWSSVYGLPLRLASDARSLDVSPVWLSQVGAAAALPWLAGLDRAAVHRHCVRLADDLRVGLGLEPAGSSIVSVTRPDAAERLTAAGLRFASRAGAARLAFHLYNTDADVARALDALTSGPDLGP